MNNHHNHFTNYIDSFSNDYMLTNLINCDRFIPQRQNFKAQQPASPAAKCSSYEESLYNQLIKKELFSSLETCPSLSSFSSQESQASASTVLSEKEVGSKLQPKVASPVKVLDVPRYKDDFYLSNVDWSNKGPIGIALEN